jgi:hypothetical protein
LLGSGLLTWRRLMREDGFGRERDRGWQLPMVCINHRS